MAEGYPAESAVETDNRVVRQSGFGSSGLHLQKDYFYYSVKQGKT